MELDVEIEILVARRLAAAGRTDEARVGAVRAARLLERCPSPRLAGLLHLLLGGLARDRGELLVAISHWLEACALLRDAGDTHALAGALSALRVLPVDAAALLEPGGVVAETLGRQLRELAERMGPPSTPPAERTLRCAADASWFEDAVGAPVRLGHRPALRAILLRLFEQHERAPIAEVETRELLDTAWPGGHEDADPNRVHVALRRLRRLGLEGVLQRWGHGYRIDPAVQVERVRSR